MARVMNIDEAMQYIHEHGFSLHYCDRLGCDLFTWGIKVPLALRRAVYKHRKELVQLLKSGDSRVCCAPFHHRRYWRRSGRRGPKICKKCLELDASMVSVEQQEAS